MEKLILVNETDCPIGLGEKIEIHQHGWLHRAFSVLIFDDKLNMLLQQRNFFKYHSGGLWSNACCGHPLENEFVAEAASRRLREEMGFSCRLTFSFSFLYRSILQNGLIENEYDHVFLGNYSGQVTPNPIEVISYKWENYFTLQKKVSASSELYTSWFLLIMEKLPIVFNF